MFEDKILERGERKLEGVESRHDPNFESDRQEVTARAPSPQESPAVRAPASPVGAETARPEATGKAHRASFVRRRPVPKLCLRTCLPLLLRGDADRDAHITKRNCTVSL